MHIDADTVVLDRNDEPVTRDTCADCELAPLRSAGESVNDCVFDERLQQEVRHDNVPCFGGRIDLDVKPISESALLNVQVCAEKTKLVAQWHVAPAGVSQRLDEQ